MILSKDTVRTYAYNAGFRDAALDAAVDIAKCESGYNTDAHKDDDVEDSRGLWQINVSSRANPQYKSWNLFDPQQNANAAYQIYKAWGNFGAWTCATILDLVNPKIISISVFAFVAVIALYLLSQD